MAKFTKDEFISGEKSIFVYGADVLFIDKEIYDEVVELLPKDFIVVNGDNDFSDYQNRAYFKNFERKVFNSNVKDVSKYKVEIARLLKEKSWASEIAWRLCRIQELFMLKEIERTDSDRYKKQIEELNNKLLASLKRNDAMEISDNADIWNAVKIVSDETRQYNNKQF